MDSDTLEARIKKIDERTTRIEQILPTLARKDDLKAFATKDDLRAYPTREDVRAIVREEGELTRQQFNAVAERIEERVKVIAEGHDTLLKRANAVDATLAAHDKRITTVEIKLLKHR